MGRKTFGSNIHCHQIYPTGEKKKLVSDMATVALVVTSDQAIELATNLLVAAKEANLIDVTGFRD
jgi:hypothetical protein